MSRRKVYKAIERELERIMKESTRKEIIKGICGRL